MSKLKVSTREIGTVRVFDLEGSPTQETLQEVAWRIQRNIRRHRLQRVIINLQMLPSLEPLGMRSLLAACIRPQRSLIYGASPAISSYLEATYLPRNVRICATEKEVAEDLGPFLLEKRGEKQFSAEGKLLDPQSVGYQLERRRSKRMHVALPIDLKVFREDAAPIETHAIATNISEGGLFAEYLDLEAARMIERIEPFKGLRMEIHIYPNANFPEEYNLKGKVIRKEIVRRQLGVAVEFLQQ